ncbi:hypothetical protein M885DRAFT_108796 [Pelagophyceae sp. CCMP2097]|nr:hypothetical protein M885DRAFT_108796 [Pelagophyceae sp. CCMP2097]
MFTFGWFSRAPSKGASLELAPEPGASGDGAVTDQAVLDAFEVLKYETAWGARLHAHDLGEFLYLVTRMQFSVERRASLLHALENPTESLDLAQCGEVVRRLRDLNGRAADVHDVSSRRLESGGNLGSYRRFLGAPHRSVEQRRFPRKTNNSRLRRGGV